MSETPTERRSTHTIRFSKAEWTTVRGQADRAGLRPTVYVRQTAIGRRLRHRPGASHREFAARFADQDRQLAWIGNNLNQLVRLAHSGRLQHDRDFLAVLDGLRTDLDATRDDIRAALDALVGSAS